MTPEFSVGDLVSLGYTGKEIYEVRAVITTGRITTYDIQSTHRKRRVQGVPERRLYRRTA